MKEECNDLQEADSWMRMHLTFSDTVFLFRAYNFSIVFEFYLNVCYIESRKKRDMYALWEAENNGEKIFLQILARKPDHSRQETRSLINLLLGATEWEATDFHGDGAIVTPAALNKRSEILLLLNL